MRNIEDYQDQYLKNYAYEPYQVKYRRNSVLEQVEKLKPRRILEIGCGVDPLFRHLTDFDKYMVVEPGKNFAETAKKFATTDQNGSKITVVHDYFIGKTDVVQGFDLVICSGLLHELPNQKEFMEYLYSVAELGTIVYVNVPNANSFHRLVAVKAGLIESVHEKSEFQIRFQQHNIFSMFQLKDLAQSVGFKVVSEGTISFKPFTHNQMQQLINHKILDENTIDALAAMVEYCPQMGSEMFVNLSK